MPGQHNKLRGLYAVTPDSADTAELVARARDALDGGASLLQYRNKTADAALRRNQAAALLACCRAAGVPLIINDDAALARELGADGVHLGREDGAVAAARRLPGTDFLIGASCYDEIARAQAAAAQGADYLAFGAAFPSSTKPGAVQADAALYARAAREFALPIAAIGGITVAKAPPLLAAGVDLLAVISDLFDAPDVAARAAAYAALFANFEELP